jgi:predicted phosphodiesterase
MRYVILSDVHGNLHALHAVLRASADDRVDRYLCLGDLVGYGPFPNECVAAVAELDAVCVAGNHDLLALGALSDARSGPLARQTTPWTRAALHDDTRRYLAALPLRARADGVVLAHGSLDDPERYVRSPETADALLDRVADEDPDARVLALGHTHHAWAYAGGAGTLLRPRATGSVRLDPGLRHLVNPGSVGQSRDRSLAARYLVLDLDRDEASFRAVEYDVRGHVAALARAGLPPGSHQMAPTLRDRARPYARKVTRRVAAVRALAARARRR